MGLCAGGESDFGVSGDGGGGRWGAGGVATGELGAAVAFGCLFGAAGGGEGIDGGSECAFDAARVVPAV